MANVQELEGQLATAKTDAAEATRLWKIKIAQDERDMATRIHDARNELGAIKKRIEALPVADKSTRPDPRRRGLARLILRETPEKLTTIGTLGQFDPTFGAIYGALDLVQGFILRQEGLQDSAVFALADDLECRTHRATLAYLRWVAGETTS